MEIKNAVKNLNLRHNGILFVIILIGVVLMLFPGGGDKKEADSSVIPEGFKTDDEARLEEILSEIKGVGEVSVMITYESGVESEIAYETNSSITRRGDGDKTANTEESSDRQAVMSSGKPFVKRYVYPEVKGAVVAAEGAGDAAVKQKIQEAVMTSLGLAAHKVCVTEKRTK